MTPAARPAVFLDRDGTLIDDKGFLGDPAGVEILPTVVDALKLLAQHRYATIVISNQSGIARGLLIDEQVRSVNAEIVAAWRATVSLSTAGIGVRTIETDAIAASPSRHCCIRPFTNTGSRSTARR